jgi:hypothetical protein
VAVRRVIVTIHCEQAHDLHTRFIHRHQDHRLLLVCRGAGIGLAHENRDLAARIAGPGCPPFAASDDVRVAVAADARGNIRRVGGSDVRFRHRKTRTNLAGEQRLEPLFFLFGRAVAREDFHVSRVRRGAIENFGRHVAAAHDFAERRVFEIRQAGAIFIVWKKKVP